MRSTIIDYPESDGLPVAESDFQRDVLTYAVESLAVHFQSRADVYVSGNLLLYYEEGNPYASVAPDVFIVFGVSNHRRRTYRLWEEGKAPDFVLEVTSQSTRQDDQGRKRRLYERLGVSEYWQYDPTGDYLSPQLQGFELIAGAYAAIPSSRLPGELLTLSSRVLGLELRLSDAGAFRFHDTASGQTLPNLRESEARVAELEARLRALQQPNNPHASD
jgi:Uma2 family endonuclease